MDFEEHYYLIPKAFTQDEFYRGLTPEAMVVYAVLKEHLETVAPYKGWVDKDGAVYLNYRIIDLCHLFGYGNGKMIKIMNMLESFNLIERERKIDDIAYRSLPYKTYIYEV